ncbi:MAG TPA: sigma-70 family RNA polymerase sigma factor [Vicinamibacterales bacterium]
MTISDVNQLRARACETDDTLQMTEEAFGVFYERTARSLWAYLSRLTGDRHLADDLLQETYYRFLRANGSYESEAHRKNYLFRIATNLARDVHRRRRIEEVVLREDQPSGQVEPADPAPKSMTHTDLARAMAKLRPRDRSLLWLAYAHGSSHREIADTLGLKVASIKLLLFRARRRLATLLRRGNES